MERLTTLIVSLTIISLLYQNIIWAGGLPCSPSAAIPDKSLNSNIIPDLNLPENIATIKERYCSELPQPKTILHVQDSHANYHAQMNIAKVLDVLYPYSSNNFLIAVEGAEGMVDVSKIQSFPHKEAKRMATDYLIKEGLMTGAEFFMANINPGKDILIWGVENRDLYKENLMAFREMQRHKDSAKTAIRQIERDLRQLINNTLNEEQRRFISKMMSYQKDEIGLEEYAVFLKEMAVGEETYKNFSNLIKLIELKQYIDFEKVEKERMALIKNISKKYVKEEMIDVVTKGLRYQVGEISACEYYSMLEKYLRDINLIEAGRKRNWKSSDKDTADKYKNLSLYMDYIKINSLINSRALFEEITQIEKQAAEGLFKTQAQKDIYARCINLTMIDKFIELRIYREDLVYFKAHKDQFYQYNSLIPFLDSFQAFCDLGIKRDGVLLENTLKKMEELNSSKAVLITGGFHTEGLKELFKEKGISYAVVSPRITRVPDKKRYTDLLMREADPFEKVLAFSGTRLALWSEYCKGLFPNEPPDFYSFIAKKGVEVTMQALACFLEKGGEWQNLLANRDEDIRIDVEEGVKTEGNKIIVPFIVAKGGREEKVEITVTLIVNKEELETGETKYSITFETKDGRNLMVSNLEGLYLDRKPLEIQDLIQKADGGSYSAREELVVFIAQGFIKGNTADDAFKQAERYFKKPGKDEYLNKIRDTIVALNKVAQIIQERYPLSNYGDLPSLRDMNLPFKRMDEKILQQGKEGRFDCKYSLLVEELLQENGIDANVGKVQLPVTLFLDSNLQLKNRHYIEHWINLIRVEDPDSSKNRFPPLEIAVGITPLDKIHKIYPYNIINKHPYRAIFVLYEEANPEEKRDLLDWLVSTNLMPIEDIYGYVVDKGTYILTHISASEDTDRIGIFARVNSICEGVESVHLPAIGIRLSIPKDKLPKLGEEIKEMLNEDSQLNNISGKEMQLLENWEKKGWINVTKRREDMQMPVSPKIDHALDKALSTTLRDTLRLILKLDYFKNLAESRPVGRLIGKIVDENGEIITEHILGEVKGNYLFLSDSRMPGKRPIAKIRCRREYIREEMIKDLEKLLESIDIPGDSTEARYIKAIIDYCSSGVEFYILEEYVKNINGFANDGIFCLYKPFLDTPVLFFHDLGESFFLSESYRTFLEKELGKALNKEEWNSKYKGMARLVIDGKEILILSHTYLRGKGTKAREGLRPLTEAERALPQGKGLEDWLFGEEKNAEISLKIKEEKLVNEMLKCAEKEEWIKELLNLLGSYTQFFPRKSHRRIIGFLRNIIKADSISKILDVCLNQLLRPNSRDMNKKIDLNDTIIEINKLLEILLQKIPYTGVARRLEKASAILSEVRETVGKGGSLEKWRKDKNMMKALVRFFKRIEKAELHHHLDGAISPEIILKILCLFPEAREQFVRKILNKPDGSVNVIFSQEVGGPDTKKDWINLQYSLQYLFNIKAANKEAHEEVFIERFGGIEKYKKARDKIRKYLEYRPIQIGTDNFIEFLGKFGLTEVALYCNPEALRIISRESTLETFIKDNVTLIEQKIHNLGFDYTLFIVVLKVLMGLEEAEVVTNRKLKTGLILCLFKNPELVLGKRYAEVVSASQNDNRSIEEIKTSIWRETEEMFKSDFIEEGYLELEKEELDSAIVELCRMVDRKMPEADEGTKEAEVKKRLLIFWDERKEGIRQMKEIIKVKQKLYQDYPGLAEKLIAVDTVGSEIDYITWVHSYSLRLAKKYGFRVTVHAGESWPEEDIWQALNRIKGYVETGVVEGVGHATALGIHPEALRESRFPDGRPIYTLREIEEIESLQRYILNMIRKKGIVIETNPSSNLLLLPKYITSYAKHPIQYFWRILKDGLIISSDDPYIFHTIGLNGELAKVWLAHPNMLFGELMQIINNGFTQSFYMEVREISEEEQEGDIGVKAPVLLFDLILSILIGIFVGILVFAYLGGATSLPVFLSRDVTFTIGRFFWILLTIFISVISPWFAHEILGHYVLGKLSAWIYKKKGLPEVVISIEGLDTISVASKDDMEFLSDRELKNIDKQVKLYAGLGIRLNLLCAGLALLLHFAIAPNILHYAVLWMIASSNISLAICSFVPYKIYPIPILSYLRERLSMGKEKSDGDILRGILITAYQLKEQIKELLKYDIDKNSLPAFTENEIIRKFPQIPEERTMKCLSELLNNAVITKVLLKCKTIKSKPKTIYGNVLSSELEFLNSIGWLVPLEKGRRKYLCTLHYEKLLKAEKIVEVYDLMENKVRRKIYLSKGFKKLKEGYEDMEVPGTGKIKVSKELYNRIRNEKDKDKYFKILSVFLSAIIMDEGIKDIYQKTGATVTQLQLICDLIYSTKEDIEMLRRELDKNILKNLIDMFLWHREVKYAPPEDYVQHYYTMYYAMMENALEKNPALALLLLADRFYALFTVGDKEEHFRIYDEIVNVWRPLFKKDWKIDISHKLINEMFKQVRPEEYKRTKHERDSLVGNIFTEKTRKKFKSIFVKKIKMWTEVKNIKIIFRGKKCVYSTYTKLERKRQKSPEKPVQMGDALHDLGAIRILTETVEEIRKIEEFLKGNKGLELLKDTLGVDGVVWNKDDTSDYINEPKDNGYRSLHLVFTVQTPSGKSFNFEIQLKTHRMHEWAEKGPAAHHDYKRPEDEAGIKDWIVVRLKVGDQEEKSIILRKKASISIKGIISSPDINLEKEGVEKIMLYWAGEKDGLEVNLDTILKNWDLVKIDITSNSLYLHPIAFGGILFLWGILAEQFCLSWIGLGIVFILSLKEIFKGIGKLWEEFKERKIIVKYKTILTNPDIAQAIRESFDRIGMIAPGENWKVVVGGSENVDDPFILLQYPADGHPVLKLKAEGKEQEFNVILLKGEGNPSRLDTDVIIASKDGNKTLKEFLKLQGVQLDKAALGMDPITTEPAGYIYQDNTVVRRDYDKILWISLDKVPLGISPASDKNRLHGQGKISPVLAFHVHPTVPYGESTILSPGDIQEIIRRYDLDTPAVIPELILDKNGNARLFIPREGIDWELFKEKEYPELAEWYLKNLFKDTYSTNEEYSQLVQTWLQKLSPHFIIVPIEDFKSQTDIQHNTTGTGRDTIGFALIGGTLAGLPIMPIHEAVIRMLKFLLDNPVYPIVTILAVTSLIIYKETQAVIEGTKTLAPFTLPARNKLILNEYRQPFKEKLDSLRKGIALIVKVLSQIEKSSGKAGVKILIFLTLVVLNILPIGCGGDDGGIGTETGGQSSYVSGESDISTGGSTDEYPDRLPLAGGDTEWAKGDGYMKVTFPAEDLRSYYYLVFEDIKKVGGSSSQLNILVQLLTDPDDDLYTDKGLCRTTITIMGRESTLSIHLNAFGRVDLSNVTGIAIYYDEAYPGIDMENEDNDGEPGFAGVYALRVEEIGGVVPLDKIARGIISGLENRKEGPGNYYPEKELPQEGERGIPLMAGLNDSQIVALFGMDMPIEDRIREIAKLYEAGTGTKIPTDTIILLREYYLKNKPAIKSVVPVIIDITAIEEMGGKLKTIFDAFKKEGIQCGILPLVIETEKDKNAVGVLKKIGIEGFGNNIISGEITISAINEKINHFISGHKEITLENSYIITTKGHEDMLRKLLGEAAAVFVVGGEKYSIAKYNVSNLRELIEVGRALGITDIINIVKERLMEDGKDEKSIDMMLKEALEGDPRRNTGEYSEKPKEYENQRRIKTQL